MNSILFSLLIAHFVVLAASKSSLGLTTDRLVRGKSVKLSWSGVADQFYPLRLQARFFNETSNGVFSVRSTVAENLTSDDFEWENVPAPLDYISSARYELILLPDGENQPRVGYEGLFRVVEVDGSDSDSDNGDGDSSTGDPSGSGANKDGGDDGNRRVGIGAGVGLGLGLPILLGSAWWLRRRRKTTKRREMMPARSKGELEK